MKAWIYVDDITLSKEGTLAELIEDLVRMEDNDMDIWEHVVFCRCGKAHPEPSEGQETGP